MSRLSRRAWYERVNAAWPTPLPTLTGPEALRAFRRLYRFAFKRTFKGRLRLTSGNRRTGRDFTMIPGTLMSTAGAWCVNPGHGWSELVHMLSHYADRSGHTAQHARMELRMIKQVVRRGWLAGKLKDQPKVAKPQPNPRDVRLARLQARLERWEAKERRAQKAIVKLRRSLRRMTVQAA